MEKVIENYDEVDEKYNFKLLDKFTNKMGWLMNFKEVTIINDNDRKCTAVALYFLQRNGGRFKVNYVYHPYFFVLPKKGCLNELVSYLNNKYNEKLVNVQIVEKEDLDMKNHLSGILRETIKLSFYTTDEMFEVRKDIEKNSKPNKMIKINSNKATYFNLLSSHLEKTGDSVSRTSSTQRYSNKGENIVELREYDVNVTMRTVVDNGFNVGLWYNIKTRNTFDNPIITKHEKVLAPPNMVVLAYDIETTKLPLKFPDSKFDQIMMISYMINGKGYLIINREVVSQDIDSFTFEPKPEFSALFNVFNEENEKATIVRFLNHIMKIKPNIFVTYNGDFFDWPFVRDRAIFHDLNMEISIGFKHNVNSDFFECHAAYHMDCFNWVKRDSYLPMGSQNLKAVARAKLNYNPEEVNPEEMVQMAIDEPQTMATYSVSDALATYHLYMQYVHPFIFALCTIIPMNADFVLRKGSGTLCESLLMIEAYKANVLCPNKSRISQRMFNEEGKWLTTQTYVGGHVEAIESGIFRANIPFRFRLDKYAIDQMIDKVDDVLKHKLEIEEKVDLECVENFSEIKQEIINQLNHLSNNLILNEFPTIYHFDVSAMYPNIILTNRLQPYSIVNQEICGACDFNTANAKCQKRMDWTWRGEMFPANKHEIASIEKQLEGEYFNQKYVTPSETITESKTFYQLPIQVRIEETKKRLTEYCRKAYRKVKLKSEGNRSETVCQRENSFYVDTVRAFRDRRYIYKGEVKKWKRMLSEAKENNNIAKITEFSSMVVLYDSLQLAHKCILNSFYGYVMRKGSRWYSMEMAGIVCKTGASIIKSACEIIEKVGRPLELDTDGIWCMLPSSFPQHFLLKLNHKKSKIVINFMGSILNEMVHKKFSNHQYHTMEDVETKKYNVACQNSIFFEVDGPYLAMILPSSKEEGKKLKKRYAVYNLDNSLAELKGFEIKRRGELKLIKMFQTNIFENFLNGTTLKECYGAVAESANFWLDVLYKQAENMCLDELFELLAESRNMSKCLKEYGSLRSTSVTTARRLVELLGDTVGKEKGLCCRYIICNKPVGEPVSERAIPVVIFQSQSKIRDYFLKKWMKINFIDDSCDIRDYIDWNYYIERLNSTIQKIITIPAALQGVENPVERCPHPDWLKKRITKKIKTNQQNRITDMFRFNRKVKSHMNDFENEPEPRHISINQQTSISIVKDDEQLKYIDHWRQVLGNPPVQTDSFDSFDEWLQFHKKKWVFLIQQMKMMKNNKYLTRKPAMVGMEKYVYKANLNLTNNIWSIIQISALNKNKFNVWIMLGSSIQKIVLYCPNIFYVNYKNELDEAKIGKNVYKTKKFLPRSEKCTHLYQYSLDYREFKDFIESFNLIFDCDFEFRNIDISLVKGIYESKVSINFRIFSVLGNQWLLDNAKDHDELISKKFNFDEFLINPTISSNDYLEMFDISGNVEFVMYYHKSVHRELVVLYVVSSLKCFVYFVEDIASKLVDLNLNLSGMYDKIRVNTTEFIFDKLFNFTTKAFRSIENAFIDLKNIIAKPENGKIAILSFKNDLNENTESGIESMFSEIPCIKMKHKHKNNLYAVLSWRKLAVDEMFQFMLELPQIYRNLLVKSKYYGIPIGNIGQISSLNLYSIDLFYARFLTKANHLWWFSTSTQPDLGTISNHSTQTTETEESSFVSFIDPNLCTSITADISISNIAISAVINHEDIIEYEGGNINSYDMLAQQSLIDVIAGKSITSLENFDEKMLALSSLRILRSFLQYLLNEISKFKNKLADKQLVQFYRWLRLGTSLFYDEALKNLVNMYMKKMCFQLISELKSLGAKIVHATFSRIIIDTKRQSFTDSISYAKYLIECIQKHQYFQILCFNCENYYKLLLWKDENNFCAFPLQLDQPDDISQNSIESHWSIANYLPTIFDIHASFESFIVGYMVSIADFLNNESNDIGCTPILKKRTIQDDYADDNSSSAWYVEKFPNLNQFCSNLIKNQLSNELFEFVTNQFNNTPRNKTLLSENTKSIWNFLPYQKSSSIYMKNIILYFITAIIEILQLHEIVSRDIIKLKSNLLKIIGVLEYSDISNYNNLSYKFVLSELICKRCNFSRSIDICSDYTIDWFSIPIEIKCTNCNDIYPKNEIEYILLHDIEKSFKLIKDPIESCPQCDRIVSFNNFCQCRQQYDVSCKRFIKKLEIFDKISKLFQFSDLIQVTEGLCQIKLVCKLIKKFEKVEKY
ncbi:DNA polymerase epsilon catalytic subunit A [Intoshia linei]|uniref:DNA polymerase epsilon catalytic subunit n=1 Tax=Intoshia linei TaxID=1819745 RepID=A0A177BCR7_9BILA|nr:DNA polymerase epsilon catalytic subunit A [Intoshia linei]